MEVEVGESPVGDTRGQKLAQAAGIDGAEFANLLKHYAAQLILKDAWFEQATDFAARSALDQHRAQKSQRISFEQRPVCGLNGHKNQSYFTSLVSRSTASQSRPYCFRCFMVFVASQSLPSRRPEKFVVESALRLETKRQGRNQSVCASLQKCGRTRGTVQCSESGFPCNRS